MVIGITHQVRGQFFTQLHFEEGLHIIAALFSLYSHMHHHIPISPNHSSAHKI